MKSIDTIAVRRFENIIAHLFVGRIAGREVGIAEGVVNGGIQVTRGGHLSRVFVRSRAGRGRTVLLWVGDCASASKVNHAAPPIRRKIRNRMLAFKRVEVKVAHAARELIEQAGFDARILRELMQKDY